jgi:hypothetical protein
MYIILVSSFFNHVQKEVYLLCLGVSRNIYKNGKKFSERKKEID